MSNLTPEALMKKVNKKWGEGSMMKASDSSLEITRIPTGILTIDKVLGGGLAKGRHCEIYGSYAVGKTYASYRFIGNAQELGYQCAFVDVEKSFDPKFAESAGVDLDELAFHRQTHGNRVIDFIEVLLRSRNYGVIVLDSIAALLPKDELENDMEKGSYGTQQAKLMSAALRRLTTANESTVLVYINQTRDAVGSMFAKAVTSGGRAMAFYAGTRIEMVRIENIKRLSTSVDPKTNKEKKTQQVTGHRVLVRIDKDKTGGAKQHDETTFVFNYATKSIDHVEELIYLGRIQGLIKESNNYWWVEGYKDEKQNGRARFKKWLSRNKAVAEELEEIIMEDDEDAFG